MTIYPKAGALALCLVSLAMSAPVSAEVTRTTDDSFVSRQEVVVAASPKEVWLALISPATWWRSEHTWSGDSANLTLTPKAGGCFCETIPEVDEPGRFTLEGSVEHMRVIQAYPETALRMVGNLGPLQSEPVTGVLTIAISKVDKGTRIVWEYIVGGPMRYEVPVIAKAVDGVMGVQLGALAKPLVVVDVPAPAKSSPPNASDEDAPGSAPSAAKSGSSPGPANSGLAPAAKPADPTQAPKPATKPVAKPEPKSPSVDDAFRDLTDKRPG